MNHEDQAWLALIISLPTRNATTRMRVWRKLKALGCGVLRDGVYLLPRHDGARQALSGQAQEVITAGGSAHLVEISAIVPQQSSDWRSLFDRSADYGRLAQDLRKLKPARRTTSPDQLARKITSLRRNFEEISGIDFFPGGARDQAFTLLEETEQTAQALHSPDEPRAASGAISRLSKTDYRRRLWATRRRPWVDRLASAWLIKRFIDRSAKFVWLDKPRDCPPRAIGFDFDAASFTHVGNRVTFEVLMLSFGLDADPALSRLATIVHFLDIGGIPVDDATGLKTILLGAQGRCRSDDRLLAESLKIFDFIYGAYQEQTSNDT
ncbi:MAG: chromate resistance protein [Burkholderiales bacterium]|nr:chromate resistance protein [Burkholderiales bacterium]